MQGSQIPSDLIHSSYIIDFTCNYSYHIWYFDSQNHNTPNHTLTAPPKFKQKTLTQLKLPSYPVWKILSYNTTSLPSFLLLITHHQTYVLHCPRFTSLENRGYVLNLFMEDGGNAAFFDWHFNTLCDTSSVALLLATCHMKSLPGYSCGFHPLTTGPT